MGKAVKSHIEEEPAHKDVWMTAAIFLYQLSWSVWALLLFGR